MVSLFWVQKLETTYNAHMCHSMYIHENTHTYQRVAHWKQYQITQCYQVVYVMGKRNHITQFHDEISIILPGFIFSFSPSEGNLDFLIPPPPTPSLN